MRGEYNCVATQSHNTVLTLNAGSSSLKFALFPEEEPLARSLSGKFERIGLPDAELTVTDGITGKPQRQKLSLANHAACVPPLLQLLKSHAAEFNVIGHRVVHGGPHYAKPQWVTSELLAELRQLSSIDPDHLPAAIELIEEFGRHFPEVPQVACFDTAFHREMPRVARLLPLPRRYDAKGIQRYGFHGLSYTYLMRQLEGIDGGKAAQGRIILAHLGNGASLAAVRDGRSIDTTMGFTPTAGLVMSTRTGDLDPGVFVYLARAEGMSAQQFNELVNKQSGLLGISETSSDVRDLLERESQDVRAAEALALFCYQAKKWIGAMAAALNGLDTLVFTGGIGENSTILRARICTGLDFLGLELDISANTANVAIISRPDSKVTLRVICTDEELLIAELALALVESVFNEPATKPSPLKATL
ncbi:MAG: acetate kinase [Pedosphaera sp.]|nr:acetate kinase [Pedosphaera sp.]